MTFYHLKTFFTKWLIKKYYVTTWIVRILHFYWITTFKTQEKPLRKDNGSGVFLLDNTIN